LPGSRPHGQVKVGKPTLSKHPHQREESEYKRPSFSNLDSGIDSPESRPSQKSSITLQSQQSSRQTEEQRERGKAIPFCGAVDNSTSPKFRRN
jgi:hypothetical protein